MCFDLENDPEEKYDLCADGPTENAEQLMSHLETYEEEMEAIKISLAGETNDEDAAEKIPLSPSQELQLRALGYIE